jgi:F-type H+-transporting ATPase subunit b
MGFIDTLFGHPTNAVAIAFIIFVALTAKPIWRAATGALDSRAAQIKQQIDEAQEMREEAQKLLAEHKRKQRDAVEEAEAIVNHAREEAKRMREHAEEELEQSLKRREKVAMERIEQAEASALREVRGQAVDLAVAAAAKLISEKLDSEKAASLTDESIKELPSRLN